MKQTVYVFSIFLALALLTGCAEQENEPMRIGMITSLTGPLTGIAQQEVIAAEYAVEQINKEGGIHGQPIELVIEDGKCTPKDAVTAFTLLADITDAAIVFGGMCTGETVGAAPLANERQIVLLSALSSGPQVKDAGDFVFRTNPVDDGSFYADYIIGNGYKNVAIVSEQTDAMQGVKNALLPKLDAANVAYTLADFSATDTDFSTLLTKLKQTEPDLLIINSNSYKNGMLIYKQATALDLTNVMGSRGFESATKEELAQLEGLSFYGAFGIVDENDAAVQEMKRRYEERYGVAPLSPYAYGSQYEDVMLAADALRNCPARDGVCIRDYLYAVKDRDSLIGSYSFDENGEPVGITFNAVRVENGTVRLI